MRSLIILFKSDAVIWALRLSGLRCYGLGRISYRRWLSYWLLIGCFLVLRSELRRLRGY